MNNGSSVDTFLGHFAGSKHATCDAARSASFFSFALVAAFVGRLNSEKLEGDKYIAAVGSSGRERVFCDCILCVELEHGVFLNNLNMAHPR